MKCAAIWLSVLFAAIARADAPRVFLLDGDHLEKARQRLRSGDASLSPALDRLKHDADQAISAGPFSVVDKQITPPSGDKHDYMSQAPYFWPNPDTADHLPYVRRDGERNPEIKKLPDHIAMRTMSDTVQTLALAYYFTSDQRYADRAALLLRTWFIDPKMRMNPNLQFAQGIPGINTGRGIGIIETLSLTSVVDAIGLLGDSLPASDLQAIRDWFSQYVTWLRESNNGRDESASKNNHGTMYDLQLSTFALFVGKDDIAKEIFNNVRTKRIAVQIELDGRQPLELERTKAWSYSIMNLRGHMQLATVAQHAGVDLWDARTTDGRSIKLALDFLTPFATDQKPWPYKQINGFHAQSATPLIRRAAEVYPEDKYRALAEKLPPLDPSDLERLIGTQLVANAQDQQ